MAECLTDWTRDEVRAEIQAALELAGDVDATDTTDTVLRAVDAYTDTRIRQVTSHEVGGVDLRQVANDAVAVALGDLIVERDRLRAALQDIADHDLRAEIREQARRALEASP